MQQRGTESTMDVEHEGQQATQTLQQPRGRINTKQKMLHRSQALREASSPPREITTPTHTIVSLCNPHYLVSETVSPNTSSPCNPLVVVSPSISPSRSPVSSCSPATTLVPSPNSRYSPSASYLYETQIDNDRVSPERDDHDPIYTTRLNRQNLEMDATKRDIPPSHLNGSRKKVICDCSNQNCIKCIKNRERSVNNNNSNINNNVVGGTNTLSVNRAARGKLKQQSSSQGSFEGSSSISPCLSRDSSSEQYTDTTGTDLERFIPDTINRSMKDRLLMFRIEQELVNLAKDKTRTHFKFPPMSSYQRMLVHRCAAYFGMDHNIESSGKCVVVNKTKNTRIPDVQFKAHMKEELMFSEEPRRSILKRDSNSMEDYSFKSPDRQYSMENRRSKSFEEREEEYEKARRRIFNRDLHDGGSAEDFGWAEVPWSSTDSETSSKFRLQLPEQPRRYGNKLIKVHSEDMGEAMRPYVTKSYSFGGYGGGAVLNRGDSLVSTHSAGPRLLTKQDSGASSMSWRLSPSSSGYKSQSQMSESVTPSPTSTPYPINEIGNGNSACGNAPHMGQLRGDGQVYWAVTDIGSVPAGSILIDPKTCEPIKNEDGSVYHYDPNDPPDFLNTSDKTLTPQRSTVSSSPTKTVIEQAPSPKKQHQRQLVKPKSNVTNSSTSPSLPYSPTPPPLPLSQQPKSFSYVQASGDGSTAITSISQQSFPVYGSSYVSPSGQDNGSVYQQPCIIYAPTNAYGLPVQQSFEARVETQQITDLSGSYYVPENPVNTPSQSLAYQQATASYWTSQPAVPYYPASQPSANNAGQPHRFSLPISPQPGFISTGYPQNILQQPAPVQSSELVPVYQSPPVQVVYTTPPNQGNVIYPAAQAPVLYAQSSPVYQNPVYTSNLPQYPQSTSNSNSCSTSTTPFPAPLHEHAQPNYLQMTQSMSQLNLGQPVHANGNYKVPAHFDFRQKTFPPAKSNKINNGKGFFMGSSQSSTGTNSPAATVVSGYCPQNPGMYRTPPETPPNQFTYNPNFAVSPMLFRQVSNVRSSTPGTNRSSRSPTPASDYERQRISLPPAVYHGMPYVMQSDTRIAPGRSQPNTYRQSVPQRPQSAGYSGDYSRSHKGRKSKGNKQTPGLPPSGKQSN